MNSDETFSLTLGTEWETAIENLTTVRDWIRFAVTAMESAECAYGQGCLDAHCEARWLVARALHLPLDTLDMLLDARLLPDERSHLAELLAARTEARVPTAYLLNEAWLQGKPFYVDERVIIPRSFLAELLAPEALARWLEKPPTAVTRVLELCTGSGCLAILAAEAFPNAQIVATDLSPDALAVAQINVESYGLAERITLAQGDLFAALNDPIEPFDLILANPPYVTTEAMANLPDEFRHEPQLALAAGDDGMTLVRRIVADAPRYLTLGGRLLVEVGHNRREAEAALAVPGKPSLPLTWLATAGHPEAVFALTAPW